MSTVFSGDIFIFENRYKKGDKNIHLASHAGNEFEFKNPIKTDIFKLGENWRVLEISNELHFQVKNEAGTYITKLKIGN